MVGYGAQRSFLEDMEAIPSIEASWKMARKTLRVTSPSGEKDGGGGLDQESGPTGSPGGGGGGASGAASGGKGQAGYETMYQQHIDEKFPGRFSSFAEFGRAKEAFHKLKV
eukprot:15431227-Alexandrium_andersonii.AAC.1